MGDGAYAPLVRALRAHQNADGGFGARVGGPSAIEPTAVALFALSFVGDPAVAEARAFLRDRQTPEGAWPAMREEQESGWPTALAVLALSRFPAEAAATRAGVRWLVGARGQTFARRNPWWEWLMGGPPSVELDASLSGWPWRGGTFTWVEPTGYAILALAAAAPDDADAQARIDEGRRVLLDRVCVDGGWNYGNRRVLDEDLWAYPDTTALALLALGADAPAEVRHRGLDALTRMLETNHSGLATALGILALAAGGRDVGGLRERLRLRFHATGFLGDARALGWAALASDAAARPFVGGEHA